MTIPYRYCEIDAISSRPVWPVSMTLRPGFLTAVSVSVASRTATAPRRTPRDMVRLIH